ncbi:hypothetical protein E3N88_44852 [Mikania micrantha]|uniref:Transmembrane 9 superfamily member n=1 Tax=Mikania micrantha TaxID=192012 RepID=A0A5N6LAV2_9ASTR|nr:hypothetical protein E3N88_44852 [Mikania micrantha]
MASVAAGLMNRMAEFATKSTKKDVGMAEEGIVLDSDVGERVGTCWQRACVKSGHNASFLYCGNSHMAGYDIWRNISSSILTTNCTPDGDNPPFDFGMFEQALSSGIVSSKKFVLKYYYCLWWGLQNLSTLGQGLQTSTYAGESLFSITLAISGLILFALLIGNMQVPLFENMDERLLDAICERLKPCLYTDDSYISVTTDGGRTGFLNRGLLKEGDFCGEELLTWALDPKSGSNLPSSTRTVKALRDVEAFALAADDLKFVAAQFRRLHSRQVQHTFRFYSQQWRTWAACFIQAAWRRHCNRKILEQRHKEEEQMKLSDQCGDYGGLGATFLVSRFATNALRVVHRNRNFNTDGELGFNQGSVFFFCYLSMDTPSTSPVSLLRISSRSFLLRVILSDLSASVWKSGVRGDKLRVKVNKLASTKTQLPYSYYSIPYCRPDKIVDSAENLGEILRGDRIENSPFEFQMLVPQICNVVCRLVLNEKTAKEFKEKIDDEYKVNMILDNLPLVVPLSRLEKDSPMIYQHGYFVGRKVQYEGTKEEKYFINNHLTFTVKYHKDSQTDSARIVGFEVNAFSVKHQYDGKWTDKTRLTTCDAQTKRMVASSDPPLEVEDKSEIIFTYDVNFQESDIKWASRWDTYLLLADDQVHWFSIINSLMIVLFLSGMVAMIMLRTLYRDISKYNQLETQEEAQEETGWKLVHGDVFRPPVNSELLCVYVGTGVQFFGMILIAMIFAVLGFLSPSNRGGLMTALLLLWVIMGIFGGYASARLYKTFKGTEWKSIALKTAFMFPGTAFAIFFFLNGLIWGEKSSGAVPFGTMFALVLLWFGISVPLVFVGSYIGFKKPVIEDPVKTNKIPRQIPDQPWYMSSAFSILIGGILPFGAVFIELFFILTSIWLQQFYYIFGFLFIVFVILIVTCAEITIVLCYFQLCSEDYLWWWRSYLTSGSSALYLFLYTIFYFFTKLNISKPVSGILYFGYMLIASYVFFVVTGAIGFYACFWFTRLIYSSVKID